MIKSKLSSIVAVSCASLSLMAQDNGRPPVQPRDGRVPLQRIEDDYRRFMKPPQTALEFWAALRFNLGVGKYQLAAEDLKGFLAANPSEADILQIVDEQGMSAFLQLLNRPELRADAQTLIERVNAVVKQQRGDAARLRKLVANLLGDAEERAYSIIELRKAGPYAVPYLVESLRANEKPADRASIMQAMLQLDRSIVPPLLAALDIDDPHLRADLIDVIYRMALKHNRRDIAAGAYLWYLAASDKQPANVRQKAREALTYFQGATSFDQLPPAPAALTAEAERYYRHQGPLVEGQETTVWVLRDGQIVPVTVPATKAEEYYGLRFARQALELDPTYEPAQIAFLNLALEKGVERAGIDQPLDTGAPDVQNLVRTMSPDLVMHVLDRALSENRTPVILAAVQTLGDLGESRALQPVGQRTPALLRALNYPDRRVQFAAANAVLRIPNPNPNRYAWRIVEILQKAITDPHPKVLQGDARIDRANRMAEILCAAGLDVVVRHTGTEVLRRLNARSDIDAVLLVVDSGERFLDQAMRVSPLAQARLQVDRPTDFMLAALPDTGLNFTLSQLRADINYGLLPVFILVAPDPTGNVPLETEVRLRRIIEPYRNVWVMPATLKPEALRDAMLARMTAVSELPLTEEERKQRSAQAVNWLRRMATGELPGYDIRPAADALYHALEVPELAMHAVEAIIGIPGADAQRRLARVVLSDGPVAVREAAAMTLSRHIQLNQLALAAEQINGLEQLYLATTDPKFRGSLAIVLGAVHPTARQSGDRLQRYDPPLNPQPPATPAPAVEKEK